MRDDRDEEMSSRTDIAGSAGAGDSGVTTKTSKHQQQGLEEETIPSSERLLSELMAALATGARAVQNLPLGDDFEYQSSFPEFRRLLEDSQRSLLETLVKTLEDAAVATPSFQPSTTSMSSYDDATGGTSPLFDFDSLEDPLLYEACTDLCDVLLEEAERSSVRGNNNKQIIKELQSVKSHAQSSFGRLLSGIVDMDKPQDVFSFGAGGDPELNGRIRTFVPPFLKTKFHYKTELNLEALTQDGHGLETKFGELKASPRLPTNIVAPSQHVNHPYLDELQSLEYPEFELDAPQEKVTIAKDENLIDNAVWIDTVETLSELKIHLEQPGVQEIAVDLEAHSFRSFAGMICLIQITIEGPDGETPKDYLIDPFPIWQHVHDALGPTFANPNVVKVFHGADSDITWLQRDFGLYVVNMFDTGRAARALKLTSFGFAHVLERYVDGVRADKSHQLSDWRQRPLPVAMKEYAIMDTHYLLKIYRAMKYDLFKSTTTSILEVLEESRKVCTIRYSPEPFRPDGYRSLTNRRGHKTELNPRQEAVLKDLWDWRDQTARKFDESQAYVCTNTQLIRLAMACPTSLIALQGLMQPMPPLLLRNSEDVLTRIQECNRLRRINMEERPPSSAFFKPAVSTRSEETEVGGEHRPSPRTLLSPVMATEALYRQAGWISPASNHLSGLVNEMEVEDIVTTSATEDDDADDEKDEEDRNPGGKKQTKAKKSQKKARRGVAVHSANQNFRSQEYTSHSLQLGDHALSGVEPGNIVDGFGPVRANHPSTEDMEEALEVAKTNAARIRTTQEKRGIIGLMFSAELGGNEADEESEADDEDEEEKDKSEQEEFIIPRSIREIYRISNRNRRNKKSSSPGPPEPNKEDLEELVKAEEVLKARSSEDKNYLDLIPVVPGSPKRQRTKSLGGASLSSSDEAGGQDSQSRSKDDDFALMKEVGWIDSKDELDNMLKGRQDTDGDDDDSSDDDGKRQTPMPFDYSNVGNIGAFASTPSSNPFFAGAALAGGHLHHQAGKADRKKPSANAVKGTSKPSRRQAERPEKREGKSQAYKKK